ncbi:hydroxymethylglutaryl-CoA lyase [Marinobacter nanhaiticus D15-8W]|uniref:Hydroxymethylglutaryl-CoA lyase n=1 Tax=Marinobacter nanhaiticus D15-8W TaxID=626887 RepID=N6WQQ2_9GAMM|nr:hydroxymethylglutaryl-CoA lyase [Marinobacter nanhaiticus]ENO13911.1 hydroxymethylglutaryl-CoA lyase [Marinobacter nanhaiticus D15-8W]BES71288.1 hydroxymethylglutaryl-CoA lyase [Marinobacter nanhaiticus D15-8W]
MTREKVTLVEVGLRDGLQNESTPVSADNRVRWFDALADAGMKRIEAGSFVSPRWVPQMANTDEVMAQIQRRPDVSAEVLVPNTKGLEGALACDADVIAVFTAASETFNRKNINCSIAESIERFQPVVAGARAAGKRVRAYVSCVVGCPYEGRIAPGQVADVVKQLLELGADEVSLGDTIGVARPREVHALLDATLPLLPIENLALHCHDTRGQAIANIYAALDRGVRTFDSAVAGLGGCPYAKGATGNVATEDVLYLLQGEGFETGVDLDALARVGHEICEVLGRSNPSRTGKALAAECQV